MVTDDNYFLFLDDDLKPQDIYVRSKIKLYEDKSRWTVVRSFEEFKNSIEYGGRMPRIISFDHDLCIAHVRIKPSFEQIGFFADDRGKVAIYYDTMGVKSGYHCAKWLVNYCVACNYPLPDAIVHYSGEAGAQNILYELDQYERIKAKMEDEIMMKTSNVCGFERPNFMI